MGGALGHIRICDFTGQLAGAGATRWLAAFGAQVIRIEDPVMRGTWDILRGSPPFKDERRGIEFGAGFQNHNVEKLGVTLNLRTERGKELLAELVRISDVVADNFAAGVLDRWGFGFDRLRELKPDVIYVSNCGFGQEGPYRDFKSWGPIAQGVCGLTFESGLPDQPPAGWGYSYMDHTGGYVMAIGILAALYHRARTGEGQWVDLSCTEAGAALTGTAILDRTVNNRPRRRARHPNSNRADGPAMSPHGIYPTAEEDRWVAIACRHDDDWAAIQAVTDIDEPRWRHVTGRVATEDDLDAAMAAWTSRHDRRDIEAKLTALGVPVAAVQLPAERIDDDPGTTGFGLWPTVTHGAMGEVRVDGYPVHFSRTDWEMVHGAPCLGEHNDAVWGGLLGLSGSELDRLRTQGVI
jgi:crotonobetainyl-CoA:carnitine CoA-transferase CaiB-like acyl-CoA transferase